MNSRMVFDVMCPLRRLPFQNAPVLICMVFLGMVAISLSPLMVSWRDTTISGAALNVVFLDGFCDVRVRLKVLVVNVPETVLMCAARCCVCRRCVDVYRVSAGWVSPHIAVEALDGYELT